MAPCRVIAATEADGEVGFTYSTLPGHPEEGVEQFRFHRTAGGAAFDVLAVSVPAFWGSRLAPRVERRVQSAATERYLQAAVGLAEESLG